MSDLKALRCFEAMAKYANLTQASIELGISDAAVSQRIKSLEARLGAKLYESRGGRVRLTEAGERTAKFATRVFDEITAFEEAISDEESRATLVLSASAPLLRYHLPGIVDSFAQEYGIARLRLLSRTPSETVELVRRNDVDLGVVHERPMPSEVVFHPWRVFKSSRSDPTNPPIAPLRTPEPLSARTATIPHIQTLGPIRPG